MAWSIILTVADHEQNGFVALAEWPCGEEEDARRVIAAIAAVALALTVSLFSAGLALGWFLAATLKVLP